MPGFEGFVQWHSMPAVGESAAISEQWQGFLGVLESVGLEVLGVGGTEVEAWVGIAGN